MYMQKPNQKTSDYMDKLRKLFDEAELQQFRAEDLLTYKAIQGCTMEPVRTKFVREEEPTFKKLEKIAHTVEAGENTLKGQPTGHVNKATVQADKAGGPWAKTQNQKPAGGANSGCKRCNGKDKSNHNLNTCRFKEAVCHTCGQKGHITGSPFCRGKQQTKPEGKSQAKAKKAAPSAQKKGDEKAGCGAVFACKAIPFGKPKKANRQKKTVKVTEVDSTGTAIKDGWNIPTPRMNIQVSGMNEGHHAPSKALPDTGCTQTIMSLKWARSHKVAIDPEGSIPIMAADGKRMMCEGSAKITIHYEGLQIKTEVLVSSVLKDEMLISWHDLVKLEIISKNFPHRMNFSQVDSVEKAVASSGGEAAVSEPKREQEKLTWKNVPASE